MAALVGIALSYAAVVAGVAGTGADGRNSDGRNDGALCAPGADACRLAAPQLPSAAEDPVYATPAEVDCRAVILIHTRGNDSGGRATDRLPLSGDCEPAPLDLRYRVSRFPDSERPSGALRSERGRRAVHAAPVATRLPPEGRAVPTAAQPMALYAAHDLAPPAARDLDIQAPTPLGTRHLDPPDRPPRV